MDTQEMLSNPSSVPLPGFCGYKRIFKKSLLPKTKIKKKFFTNVDKFRNFFCHIASLYHVDPRLHYKKFLNYIFENIQDSEYEDLLSRFEISYELYLTKEKQKASNHYSKLIDDLVDNETKVKHQTSCKQESTITLNTEAKVEIKGSLIINGVNFYLTDKPTPDENISLSSIRECEELRSQQQSYKDKISLMELEIKNLTSQLSNITSQHEILSKRHQKVVEDFDVERKKLSQKYIPPQKRNSYFDDDTLCEDSECDESDDEKEDFPPAITKFDIYKNWKIELGWKNKPTKSNIHTALALLSNKTKSPIIQVDVESIIQPSDHHFHREFYLFKRYDNYHTLLFFNENFIKSMKVYRDTLNITKFLKDMIDPYDEDRLVNLYHDFGL